MKQVIHTEHAPAAIGPYSQAVKIGDLLFTSGQIPVDPATGAVPEGGIQAQAQQSLSNIKAILNAAGTNMGAVIKTTVFLSDMNDFAAMNEVYAQFFQEPYPARSAVQVARLPRMCWWRLRPSPSCELGFPRIFPSRRKILDFSAYVWYNVHLASLGFSAAFLIFRLSGQA